MCASAFHRPNTSANSVMGGHHSTPVVVHFPVLYSYSFVDNVRCVGQGNPKDALKVINHGIVLAIQAKGLCCLLDTVL